MNTLCYYTRVDGEYLFTANSIANGDTDIIFFVVRRFLVPKKLPPLAEGIPMNRVKETMMKCSLMPGTHIIEGTVVVTKSVLSFSGDVNFVVTLTSSGRDYFVKNGTYVWVYEDILPNHNSDSMKAMLPSHMYNLFKNTYTDNLAFSEDSIIISFSSIPPIDEEINDLGKLAFAVSHIVNKHTGKNLNGVLVTVQPNSDKVVGVDSAVVPMKRYKAFDAYLYANVDANVIMDRWYAMNDVLSKIKVKEVDHLLGELNNTVAFLKLLRTSENAETIDMLHLRKQIKKLNKHISKQL